MLDHPWSWKPPLGWPLDRTAPLTKGLVGFYALNEGAGNTARDAMRNLDLAATGFGSANPWGVGTQSGIASVGSNEYIGAALPASQQLALPMSLACAFRPTGSISNNTTLFGISHTSFLWTFGLYVSGGTIVLRWDNAGTAQFLSTSFTLAANVDYVVGAVIQANFQGVYVNSAPIASGATALSNPQYSSPYLGFAELPGSSGSPATANCIYYWGALWNRALSAAEHAAIGAGPNAIWRHLYLPPRTRAVSVASPSIYRPNVVVPALNPAYWN